MVNDFQLIIDDEKYFTLSNESVSTNRGFYSSDKGKTPPQVKFKRNQKYQRKVLVRIAISTNGISSPFFPEQQQAINELHLITAIASLVIWIKTMYNL
ncbi:unnamed protein product [Adineta ricciae]|uniref:Uncharacterized protein n=1 Tax=Adineta ricciae TaxID=249248 RepID=A0A815ER11_ADIRI|nr:unnamed protein product [Adineta ricciae]